MSHRLHVTKLKPGTPAPPEVLGQSTTIEITNDLPNLQQAHATMRSFHENAPLLVALLGAGTRLFPTGS